MRQAFGWMTLGAMLSLASMAASLWGARAQAPAPAAASARSIQDALLRPLDLPFKEPTTLHEVAERLATVLGSPVVVDRAAVERSDLDDEATVQLELHGVRLKTALQLLLDQVSLTYRVIPEDNLLVITDNTGTDDPSRRVLAEVEAIHDDIHALQDAVDELFSILGTAPAEEMTPELRTPTIIEEAPDDPHLKPAAPGPSRAG